MKLWPEELQQGGWVVGRVIAVAAAEGEEPDASRLVASTFADVGPFFLIT